MRRLVITRGPQGSGKTTFLREAGLGDYRLSGDDVRRLLSSPVLGSEGRMGLNQSLDRRAWKLLGEILDERMERGDLVALDATHPRTRDFTLYRELSRRHRYELVCVDFSAVPLERCLAHNAQRRELHFVPEDAIRRTWAACQDGRVPDDVEVISWAQDGSHFTKLASWLDEPVLELSSFRRVHHIGDLQGCLSPLLGYLDGLDGPGLDPRDFWIFVGDLCDRGPENGEVLRWMLDHALADNVRIHWGNHEDHLHRWATGQAAVSREFQERTLPQLRAEGLTPEDAERLCAALVDQTRYTFHGTRVLVTHAGLSTVPESAVSISTFQYARGTGSYSDPVDAAFDRCAPPGWIQVHGHRNHHDLPVRASQRSFNLEQSIEYGGRLRIAVLGADGWETHALKNRSFRPYHSRLDERLLPFHRLIPDWVHPEMDDGTRLAESELAAFRNHPLIRVKPAASRPHVVSLNFTRDAFQRAEWDELTLRARGLFVDAESGEVVARSYDKFFNLGERPETQPEALAESLVFPVEVWVKENGFLGLLGYDRRGDDLFWSSKSTPDSDFASWFREIAERALSPTRQDVLRRYLRDTQSCLIFEVLDPVRDPHIIEVDDAGLVLLDCVHRGAELARLSHGRLEKLGAYFGFRVKERAMTFPDWPALERWIEVATAPGWTLRGRHVEGFVLEDAAGFQTKIKLDHYAFWKRMRSLKDRVRRIRGTQRPLQRKLDDPRARAFHDWLVEQSDEALEQSIIALRRAYLAERGFDEAPSAEA